MFKWWNSVSIIAYRLHSHCTTLVAVRISACSQPADVKPLPQEKIAKDRYIHKQRHSAKKNGKAGRRSSPDTKTRLNSYFSHSKWFSHHILHKDYLLAWSNISYVKDIKYARKGTYFTHTHTHICIHKYMCTCIYTHNTKVKKSH